MPSGDAIQKNGWAEARLWLFCLLLYTPMLLIYAGHFFLSGDAVIGTGFLQDDQPYYLANAREHFDSGVFSFFYALPFSPFAESPRLYIQPLSLLLGSLGHFGGFDPGHLYVAFGIVAALACARMAMALFAFFVGLSTRAQAMAFVCFFWGGGLLAATGVLYGAASGNEIYATLFIADPFEGLWFLNFGRNLFYGTESFYHLIFFATVLLILKGRYVWALAGLAFMSASHPFTGVQLLLVTLAWIAATLVAPRRETPPVWFAGGALILLACHLGYYLILLNTSPEHAIVQGQWTLPWGIGLVTIVPAYILAATLAVLRMNSREKLKTFWAGRQERFLMAWFAVSFLLANHDLFISPIQPIHFTRGYIYIPLFLMGAPVLVRAFEKLLAMRVRVFRITAVSALFFLFLFDNAAWFARHGYAMSVLGKPLGIVLETDLAQMYSVLSSPRFKGYLLVPGEKKIGELATVYTPLRAWASHGFNTPRFDQRMAEVNRFLEGGAEPENWKRRPLAVLVDRQVHGPWVAAAEDGGFTVEASHGRYVLFVRPLKPGG